MVDLNANDVDAAMRIIEGTARSMGLEVEEGLMALQGKRYRQGAEQIDRARLYPLPEAFGLIEQTARRQVRRERRCGDQPRCRSEARRPDGARARSCCPTAPASTVRVLVFAKGDKEKEAREAGADHVGAEDLAKKIQDEGWLEFDRVIATPDMMGVVGRLGQVLGPRGLMPNPKLGTVTLDVARAVSESKAGKVEYRVDKTGIIHVSIGKRSFGAEKLLENAGALLDAILKAKPAAAKGTYLKKIAVSTTMGPGIRIDPSSVAVERTA